MSSSKKINAPAKINPYPKQIIDRSMMTESARRNISVIIWYKRLISGTFALLLVSAFFTVIAALCAWRQPAPMVYASAIDGPLYQIELSRTGNINELSELLVGLHAEQDSKRALSSERKANLQKQEAETPIVPEVTATPAEAPRN